MKETFCILPWIQLEIRTDGTLAPCCASRDRLEDRDGRVMHLSSHRLADAFSSPTLKKMRKDLGSGKKIKACSACWDDEKFGRESLRQQMNRAHPSLLKKILSSDASVEQPRRLDLKVGRTCNLKCRICGPASSSKWHEEFIAVEGEKAWKDATVHPELIDRWPESEEIWNTLRSWLGGVERICFLGGEPFLNKRYLELLRFAVETGASKRLAPSFLSNGTVFPEKLVREVFPKFKSVHVGLSIDGIEKQFEYQRHPAKWDAVFSNFKRFSKSGCSVRIEPTVSALNSLYVPKYVRFWKERGAEVNFGFVHSPPHLSLSVYPARVKPEIAKVLLNEFGSADPLFKTILRNMMAPGELAQWRRFVASVDSHDRYRSESFARVFPELFELLRPFWRVDLGEQEYVSE